MSNKTSDKNVAFEKRGGQAMTQEQEVAINNIKTFIKSIRSDLAEESRDNQQLADDMETVLNMLKEKDKYIKNADNITTEMNDDIKNLTAEIKQKDKEIENLQKELNKENKRCMFEEQVIDLMAECIEWIGKSNGMPLDREHGENYTKKDIKEYFERKLRD